MQQEMPLAHFPPPYEDLQGVAILLARQREAGTDVSPLPGSARTLVPNWGEVCSGDTIWCSLERFAWEHAIHSRRVQLPREV